MADKDLSRIVDASGNNWNIKAKGLESQVKLSLTGDITGNSNVDFDSDESISTTIANDAVTTSKIKDSNVTTAKIADGAVTLDKIAVAAKSGSVSDNDGNLATHSQVKAYVDAAVTGNGSYLGKKTVADINTWVAANLNNGDHCICSDAGTLTLGNITVRAGEDIIFFKNGSGESQVAKWETMDGEFKLKQIAKSSPTASGTATAYIDTISQDENGEIKATKKNIPTSSTTIAGLVKIQTSVGASESNNANAVTPKAVRDVINALDVTDTAESTKFVTAVSETDGKVNVSRARPEISDVNGLSDALGGKEGSFTINYRATDKSLIFSKTFGTAT